MKKITVIFAMIITLSSTAQKEWRALVVQDAQHFAPYITKLQVRLPEELVLTKDTTIKKYAVKNGIGIETTDNKNKTITFPALVEGVIESYDSTNGLIKAVFSIKHRKLTLAFRKTGSGPDNGFQLDVNEIVSLGVSQGKHIMIDNVKYTPSTNAILLEMYGLKKEKNHSEVIKAEGKKAPK